MIKLDIYIRIPYVLMVLVHEGHAMMFGGLVNILIGVFVYLHLVENGSEHQEWTVSVAVLLEALETTTGTLHADNRGQGELERTVAILYRRKG